MTSVTIDVRTGRKTEVLGPDDELARARATMQCSPAQMRLALHRSGLLATVQAIADSDPEASIVWEYATVILRASPFIAAMKGAASMTDEQIDALFAHAATL